MDYWRLISFYGVHLYTSNALTRTLERLVLSGPYLIWCLELPDWFGKARLMGCSKLAFQPELNASLDSRSASPVRVEASSSLCRITQPGPILLFLIECFSEDPNLFDSRVQVWLAHAPYPHYPTQYRPLVRTYLRPYMGRIQRIHSLVWP